MSVTLEQVLAARENRAATQRRLLGKYGKPLVCLTMNIPGEEKTAPEIARAFEYGCNALRESLPIVYEEVLRAETGYEAFFVCDCAAQSAKKAAMQIEEATPAGRLFDIDVLNEAGEKLSRPEMRKCIICGGPVSVCSRSRAHGLPALEAKVKELLLEFQ